ncbi:hypothetical protein Plhal304r1_c014g0051901 [Plasmopara halstedii]
MFWIQFFSKLNEMITPTYSIPTFFCCHDTAIGKEKQDPIIASPVIKRSFMILCGLIVEESQDAVSAAHIYMRCTLRSDFVTKGWR